MLGRNLRQFDVRSKLPSQRKRCNNRVWIFRMMLRKATSVVGGIGNKELCRCARTASSRSPKVAKSFTRFTSTIGSSAAPAPPLLLKLRNDMKSAMKNKDTER